jgi:7-cyano-7-deazaguanine synthase
VNPQPPKNSERAEPNAVVLLSGGLDSTTVLAIAKSEGFAVHALSFRYGQRHSAEIDAAKRIASRAGVRRHHIVDIDLTQFGGSALTADIPVPKDRDLAPSSREAKEIPVTYVPARNTIFLSYALALAEVTGSSSIFIGVNALDYSGYPDCRPEYIKAFEEMANLATRAAVEGKSRVMIRTPLISLSKAAIITLGTSLGVDYSHTTSCYDPGRNGEACGRCDACQLRLKGFSEAGLADPIEYAITRGRKSAGGSLLPRKARR